MRCIAQIILDKTAQLESIMVLFSPQLDCSYTGHIELGPESVPNAEDCQDLLVELGTLIGASYFVQDIGAQESWMGIDGLSLEHVLNRQSSYKSNTLGSLQV